MQASREGRRAVTVSRFALLLVILALVAGVASQLPIRADAQASHLHAVVRLPQQAETQNVVSLGEKIEPSTGKSVKGLAFVTRRASDLLQNTGVAATTITNTSQCYGFFGDGVKWKTAEPWVFNAQNDQGLSENTLFALEAKDISKWEDAADGKVGDNSYVNILGTGSLTAAPLDADPLVLDGVNKVFFGDIQTPGIIAVTIIWAIIDGPVDQRQIVEWDQIFDDVDFQWSDSATADPLKMDFENISTHEVGHSVGLADLYDPACAQQTEYAYSANGETQERTLANGDIQGVSLLYSGSPSVRGPSSPSHLAAKAVSPSQIALYWNAAIDGSGIVGGYDIWRNNEFLATVTDTRYVDSNLTRGTAYHYYVVAKDLDDNPSPRSSIVAAKTLPTSGSGGVFGFTFGDNGVLPGVKLIVTGHGQTKSTTSNSQGFYSFLNFAPDTYILTAERNGYQTQTFTVTVSANFAIIEDVNLPKVQ